MAAHPKGGNHLGQLILNGKLYTIGGFTNQNNTPFADCYVYTIATNTWATILATNTDAVMVPPSLG